MPGATLRRVGLREVTCPATVDAGLAGHINLTRHVSDRPIRKTEAFTKTLVFHAYLATSMSDLDELFGRWLAEARAIGDGAHLSREAPGRCGPPG